MDIGDIDDLLGDRPDRDLSALEADVWRGIEARRLAERQAATVLKVQTALAVAAVTVIVAWGGAGSLRVDARTRSLDVLSPRMALAPSTRLLGSGR